jgi:hypothetical protein
MEERHRAIMPQRPERWQAQLLCRGNDDYTSRVEEIKMHFPAKFSCKRLDRF